MKYSAATLFSFALLGCSYNQLQNDLADNKYLEKERHSDSSATYIGEWADTTDKWRKFLRITSDGRIKVFLYPGFGSCEGKIYKDKERYFLILKDGTIAKIISASKDHLLLEAYSRQEEYEASPLPINLH